MSPEHVVAIRGNIFEAAHSTINDWERFSWHHSNGAPDAHVLHSSQAFCLSVWGAFACRRGGRIRTIVSALLGDSGLSTAFENESSAIPITFESDSREVLNEYSGNQSHLDALLKLPAITVVIESKLTEPLGQCSQRTAGHCSGVYGSGSDLKLKTDAACRLEYQDRARTPRNYWKIMREISSEGAYPPHEPCAFAKSGYQVMRNIAAAWQYARNENSDWRVIFAYPGDARTTGAIRAIQHRLRMEHRPKVLTLNYRDLASALVASEDPVANGLGKHMTSRLAF